jgi:hypothetical protein
VQVLRTAQKLHDLFSPNDLAGSISDGEVDALGACTSIEREAHGAPRANVGAQLPLGHVSFYSSKRCLRLLCDDSERD